MRHLWFEKKNIYAKWATQKCDSELHSLGAEVTLQQMLNYVSPSIFFGRYTGYKTISSLRYRP